MDRLVWKGNLFSVYCAVDGETLRQWLEGFPARVAALQREQLDAEDLSLAMG